MGTITKSAGPRSSLPCALSTSINPTLFPEAESPKSTVWNGPASHGSRGQCPSASQLCSFSSADSICCRCACGQSKNASFLQLTESARIVRPQQCGANKPPQEVMATQRPPQLRCQRRKPDRPP
ncbi:hypothetical protein Nepgr_003019 [Nepenthes gracilis]|uniref:Uncharacterized protein n=1 Tax=Nepenthes gracilis TaxID=150966 RepID=A0AAD3RYQ9_NEPGR|nr:hypothetical protein Nepgr_003019 [Nepenthes gracilis]